MNRMTKLFQQKANRAFDQYLLCKKKSVSDLITEVPVVKESFAAAQANANYPGILDVAAAVLKAESDTWAKAAELLRKEEMNR
jgi:hypothetical protein